MLSARQNVIEPLLVSGSSDINGSVNNDTIVQKNCYLHVRGNLKGSLTIEEGAKVVVEGSVDGKVVNRGGRLIVNNNGIAEFVAAEGPLEAEVGGILKINLSAIVMNWGALARRSTGECAALLHADAYRCGIEKVTAALAKSGCRTFFVANLAEARRVRAVSADAAVYVLGGLLTGSGPTFAEINAQPVINTLVEMAEWDVFAASHRWSGGFALNVDTGTGRLGISADEAAALATRVHSPHHSVTLLMSHLDHAREPDHPQNDRQLKLFHELRRLFSGVPASIADASGVFLGPKAHADMVRAGGALFGVNPTSGADNPMLPVVEMQGRIAQIHNLAPGESIAFTEGYSAKRRSRVAVVSVGFADGYPRVEGVAGIVPQAVVGGRLCPLAGRPAIDLLAVDITDVADPKAARLGDMVTLIGGQIGIDAVAAAAKSTGDEILCHIGSRFRRYYHA